MEPCNIWLTQISDAPVPRFHANARPSIISIRGVFLSNADNAWERAVLFAGGARQFLFDLTQGDYVSDDPDGEVSSPGRIAMADEGNEPPTTPLKYPMVDLFTGGLIMPLMYVNALAAWYLMSLNAPRLFTEAWMKALESQREQNRQV
jgi:hypothetical protein